MPEAFYFGKREHLFGAYHQPDGRRNANGGVVVCHPLGQEYLRCHRTLVQLARRLAAEGLHVLRFDLSGCGDSLGGTEHWSLDVWQKDLEAAIEELRTGTGVSRVGVIGLRLGCSIVARHIERGSDVAAVVLWEPIADGAEYLHELDEAHHAWRRESIAWSRRDLVPNEALGFVIPEELREQVKRMRWRGLCSAPRALVLAEDARAQQFEAEGTIDGADIMSCRSDAFWEHKNDELEKVVVPDEAVKTIAAWLCETLR